MIANAEELRARVEAAYSAGEMDAEAVEETIRRLDRGQVRSAEKGPDGWTVNEWVKKAILLYFRLRSMETVEVGQFEYRDKIPLKHDLEASGVRVVPPAVARYGSFLSPDVIMMPSYVNIGAWIGAGTMVDTWATVGSCAQVGARVHLAGGVGIGGVLEPVPSTSPGRRPSSTGGRSRRARWSSPARERGAFPPASSRWPPA